MKLDLDFHDFRTYSCWTLDTIRQVFVGRDPDTYFQSWTLGTGPRLHLPFQSALIQQRICVSCVSAQLMLSSVKACLSRSIWVGFVFVITAMMASTVVGCQRGNDGFAWWWDFHQCDLKGIPKTTQLHQIHSQYQGPSFTGASTHKTKAEQQWQQVYFMTLSGVNCHCSGAHIQKLFVIRDPKLWSPLPLNFVVFYFIYFVISSKKSATELQLLSSLELLAPSTGEYLNFTHYKPVLLIWWKPVKVFLMTGAVKKNKTHLMES